ncbi:endoplasmic reticulum membrane-associated RNA degradation protein-like isoform X2 [Dermacentor andersoni]|uniref:endoplasmic reticulum membrane-associated RNA degradation protein-like isoform X2 n=1 Tax=Dermacentor andersoni TaxID=34620 RepID=UPI0024179395|nr:endoplasmic reticulum membrane-associated RNA degradation protein-like isoform X2 [Dermacentor andersoni]
MNVVAQTCLSPNVWKMICETGISGDLDNILTEALTIDTPRFRNILDSCEGVDHNETWYCRALKLLSPSIHHIKTVYAELSVDSFRVKAVELSSWTGAEEDIQDCFGWLKCDDPCGPVLAVLRITAILEHSLGDVLFGKGIQVPFLLKDILSAPQLHEVFGPELMTLLQVIVGPPQSLNLRNVVWHGFVRSEEVDSRYAYLLICIVLSLGEQMRQRRGVDGQDIQRRKCFSLERHAVMLDDFHDVDFSRDDFLSILESSALVLPGQMAYWQACMNLLSRALYAECLTLALPQLECVLRVLYTKVNDCSHRLLTAEMSTLYTTMDEVLAKDMESGLPNAVRVALGDPHFEMFLDIFSYLEGPRLRDKVSHGEVDLRTVSEGLVLHLLHLTAITCSIELLNNANTENGYATVLRKVSNSYRAHFHPTQLLWRKVQEAIPKLHRLCTNRVIGEGITANQKIGEMDTCIRFLGEKWNVELPRSWNSSLLADLELLTTSVADSAPATVFRPRKELMVVTLLRRMCDEACITLDQLNDTLTSRAENWNLRGLRSRRRENFKRLLESVPVLYDGISLTLWIIFCCIRRVNDTELLDELQFDKFLRLLKALVKFVENLHSQTSPSQNRWDESCKLSRDCVALLLQHLNNDSTTLYSSLSGHVL